MANTPKIRFKNFSDEWEVRKLGEIANYRRGSFPQPYGKSEWYDGEEAKPFIQVADITDSMNLVSDTKQKISKLAQPMSVFAEKGSVLVTLQGSIGRVAITQYGAFVDRTVLIFEKYKIDIDNLFWAYIIKQKFIKEARKAPGGTIKTITKEALSDFDLLLSNYNEQQKIGAFFSKLDKLIALHQSKFEKLQKIKKSCLQNLFPQNNQNTPKIRFKNFSDEWENNNLGEICKIIKGEQINKLSLLENGKYYVLNGGISPSGYINTYNTLENTISISEGGNSCGYVKFNIEKFWSGGHNYTLNELKTKTLFLYSFLKAKQQKIMALRVGSGLPNIQKNTLSNISISIPNKKEQEKIGAFFSKLDKLITLHQSKFEKLQKIKKSCLQNMFV